MRIKMSKEKKIEKNPKLIKGAELKGKELVRICNPNKIHYNYEWHDGENVDILPFNAEGECLPGGLYFTTLEHLLYYNNCTTYLGDHWFVRVTVDDNEDVWQEFNGKWKAHRVMVTSMTHIKDLPEELLYHMATSYLYCQYQFCIESFNMANREELWCKVVAFSPCHLQFVRNQTDKICRAAINENSHTIKFVHDPILAANLVDELNLVPGMIDWSCGLIVALHESGKYKFKCTSRYVFDNILNSFNPEVLRMSCESDDEFYSQICLDVFNSDDILLGVIRDPSREMVDLVLGQQQ